MHIFLTQDRLHDISKPIICWNFFHRIIIVLHDTIAETKDPQNFRVELDAIESGSSEFRVAIINSFEQFPHFFGNQYVVPILNKLCV